MPPGKKLANADVELLAKWVDTGGGVARVDYHSRRQGCEMVGLSTSRPAGSSFRSRRKSNPIDAFISDKLRAAKLKPSAEADRFDP